MTNSPTKIPSLLFSILTLSLILNPQPLFAGHNATSSSHFLSRHRRARARSPPPQPPPKSEQLLVFADERLAVIYPIIQKFKSTITSDPLNITMSWSGSDICNYTGFFCESPPDNASATAVASVDFNGFRLTAPTLHGFLDNLHDIALFHANSNDFGGTISPETANLRYLYELDISNNRLSGQFPNAVLGMESLSFLDIRFNLFAGSVPPQIFTQNLDALFINDNGFVQINLPKSLGTSSHIVFLTLANNKLIGPIVPMILKLFSSVTEVLLSNNELSGCLPYEIGLLKAARVFDVSHNRLTGPLPVSLACLDNVEHLNFAGNMLYGMVPESVCEVLENLAKFSLSDNYFMYVGPVCRRLIERGILDVDNNCVADLPNQRSVSECVAFFSNPRKLCPYMWSYNHIPCEPPHFRSHVSFSPQLILSPP